MIIVFKKSSESEAASAPPPARRRVQAIAPRTPVPVSGTVEATTEDPLSLSKETPAVRKVIYRGKAHADPDVAAHIGTPQLVDAPRNGSISDALSKLTEHFDTGPLGTDTNWSPQRSATQNDEPIRDLFHPGAYRPTVSMQTLQQGDRELGVGRVNPLVTTTIAGKPTESGVVVPDVTGNLVRVLDHPLHAEDEDSTDAALSLRHLNPEEKARAMHSLPRLGPTGIQQGIDLVKQSFEDAGVPHGSRLVWHVVDGKFKLVGDVAAPRTLSDRLSLRDNGVIDPSLTLGVPLFTSVSSGANSYSGIEQSITRKPQRSPFVSSPLTHLVAFADREKLAELARMRKLGMSATSEEVGESLKKIKKLNALKQYALNPDTAPGSPFDAEYATGNRMGIRFLSLAPGMFGGVAAPPAWHSATRDKQAAVQNAYDSFALETSYLTPGLRRGLFPFLHGEHTSVFTETLLNENGSARTPSEFFDIVGSRADLEVPVISNTSLVPGTRKVHFINTAKTNAPVRTTMDNTVFWMNPKNEEAGDLSPAYVYVESSSGNTVIDSPMEAGRASWLASGLQSFSHWGVALTDQGSGYSPTVTRLRAALIRAEKKAVKENPKTPFDKIPEIIDLRKQYSDEVSAALKKQDELANTQEYRATARGFLWSEKQDDGTWQSLFNAGEGLLTNAPVPTLDLTTKTGNSPYLFNPLITGSIISAVSMHPSSVDTITELSESPWARLRRLSPGRATHVDSKRAENLSQSDMAKFGLRALVRSFGVDGYAWALKSPDGHVIQLHKFQWSPAEIAVQSPRFGSSLFGSAITNTIEHFNSLAEKYARIRRVESSAIYDHEDSGTTREELLRSELQKREGAFALYAETPLWQPVRDKTGKIVEGQFERSPNYGVMTKPNPGYIDPITNKRMDGIAPELADSYGIGEQAIISSDDEYRGYYPHDTDFSPWNRNYSYWDKDTGAWKKTFAKKYEHFFGFYESAEDNAKLVQRYVLSGDSVRGYTFGSPEKTKDADEISKYIYSTSMTRHHVASGSYTIIAQRERTVREVVEKELYKDLVLSNFAKNLSKILPTSETIETNRGSLQPDQYLLDRLKEELEQNQMFSDHYAKYLSKQDIESGVSLKTFSKKMAGMIARKLNIDPSDSVIKQVTQVVKSAALSIESASLEGEVRPESDIENENKKGLTPIVSKRQKAQDVVTGAYRLFQSKQIKFSDKLSLSNNENGETVLFIPASQTNEGFLDVRAGQQIGWGEHQNVKIQENKGDHNSPVFIKSAFATSLGMYCTLSKSQEHFSDGLKNYISGKEPLCIYTKHEELIPVLPSDIRPYDGFIEQQGRPLSGALFASMLFPSIKGLPSDQEKRVELLRYFNNAAAKRDPLQTDGIDADGEPIPNQKSGFLKKLGINVDVADSHYMFASLNPDHYNWAKESEEEPIDLENPIYHYASLTSDSSKMFQEIKKSRRDVAAQQANVRSWSQDKMKTVATNIKLKKLNPANYAITSIMEPTVTIDTKGNEITRDADDNYIEELKDRGISEIGEEIPIENIRINDENTRQNVLGTLFVAMGGRTPGAAGRFSTDDGLNLYGIFDTFMSDENDRIGIFRKSYGKAVSDRFMSLIGMDGTLSNLVQAQDESILDNMKGIHPELAGMFQKILNMSREYGDADSATKEKIQTESILLSQKILYSQIETVLNRIKMYKSLSINEKIAFCELDDMGVVGNFDKLLPGMPEEEYVDRSLSSSTTVTRDDCMAARVALGELARRDSFGKSMLGNKGLYRSTGSRLKLIMQHELNPDEFQPFMVPSDDGKTAEIKYVRALEYPQIKPEIKRLAETVGKIVFGKTFDKNGKPILVDDAEKSILLDMDPDLEIAILNYNKRSINGKLTAGESRDFRRDSILQSFATAMNMNAADIPAGMIKLLKDKVTTSMALTVAAQASAHAMSVHRQQEDMLATGKTSRESPGKLSALPAGLSGEWQAYADYGHGADLFDGVMPPHIATPTHSDDSFLPPRTPDLSEKPDMTIKLKDGREFAEKTPFPACLPTTGTSAQLSVALMDTEIQSQVGTTFSTSMKYEDAIRDPSLIRAIFAGVSSPRWSMLRILGDDDGGEGVIKKYFGVSSNTADIGQQLMHQLKTQNALNGILVAANIGLGMDEGFTEQTPTKKVSQEKPYRIDGNDNQLGRAKATSGIYLTFSSESNNITQDGNKITIREAILTEISKRRGNTFVREHKMIVPIVLSWQTEDGKTKINMSDIRKKIAFFTQIADQKITGFDSESVEYKTSSSGDRQTIIPSVAQRLVGETIETANIRMFGNPTGKPKTLGDLFSAENIPTANAFNALWEAPTSYDNLPVVAGAQRQKAVQDVTGWEISTPEQMKAIFGSSQFAYASSHYNWGSSGVIIGRVTTGSQIQKKRLAIVFVPMKPSEVEWFPASDHVDRENRITDENLAHDAVSMAHFRSMAHSVLTGSTHNPESTADDEIAGDNPWFIYGNRKKISLDKNDGMRLGRPMYAGPEMAAIRRITGLTGERPRDTVFGRFMLMELPSDGDDQFRNQGAGDQETWISFSDTRSQEEAAIIKRVQMAKQELDRLRMLRSEGRTSVDLPAVITDPLTLTEAQRLQYNINKKEEELHDAQIQQKRSGIASDTQEQFTIVDPSAVLGSWDPQMILTHESVAKMAPYMAYWITQSAQLLHGDPALPHETSIIKTIDAILGTRLEADDRATIEKAKEKIEAKMAHSETTAIPIPAEFHPVEHDRDEDLLHKKSSSDARLLELPDFLMEVDPLISDRRPGFSTARMLQVLDALPEQMKQMVMGNKPKIDLSIVSHNGARHEFPGIIDEAPGSARTNPIYTWRRGNVIYASTIGVNPQDEFLNNLADVFANAIWLPKKGFTSGKNIYGLDMAQADLRSREFAKSVLQKSLTIKSQPSYGQLDPSGRRWIDSVLDWHLNATKNAEESYDPMTTTEPKDEFVDRYSSRVLAQMLHREWFKYTLLNGAPSEILRWNKQKKENEIVTTYNNVPPWATEYPSYYGLPPEQADDYFYTDAAKKIIKEGNVPPIASPPIKSLEDSPEGLSEQYERLDDEQKVAARFGVYDDILDPAYKSFTGALAIKAFAGTGKTTTITHRVAELVNFGFTPDQFFIASFTVVSSRELRKKINEHMKKTGLDEMFLSGDATEVFTDSQVHTWHGHARKMLLSRLPVPSGWVVGPEAYTSEGQTLIDLYHKEIYDKNTGTIIYQKGTKYNKNNMRIIDEENFYDKKLVDETFRNVLTSLGIPKFTIKNGQKIDRIPEIKRIIDEIKSLGITPAQFEQRLDIAKDSDETNRQIARIYKKYQDTMEENGRVDQTDLLNMVVSIFERDKTVLRMYQAKFRQFLVDEYQDQNGAQEKLLSLLAKRNDDGSGGSGNITVVGDSKQAIYYWRGSSAEFLENFTKNYGYENKDGKKIEPQEKTINTNHRSTGNIIKGANPLMSADPNNPETQMKPSSSALEGAPIEIVECQNEQEQGDYISQEILRLVGSNHTPDMTTALVKTPGDLPIIPTFGDIMIITRRVDQAMEIVRQLQKNKIPASLDQGATATNRASRTTETVPEKIRKILEYNNEKGSSQLFELTDILDLSTDNMSSNQSYGSTAEAKSNKILSIFTTLSRFMRRNNAMIDSNRMNVLVAAYELHINKNPDDTIMQFITKNPKILTNRQIKALEKVSEIRQQRSSSEIIAFALSENSSFGKMLRKIAFKEIANKKYYDANEVAKFLTEFNRNPSEATKKIRDEIQTITSARNQDQDLYHQKSRYIGNSVRVLTIHKAKGTEAPVVFNPYWIQGSMPISQSETGGFDARQEERNLAYVSLTRAKHKAYVLYPSKTTTRSNKVRDASPSPFLAEIPPECSIRSTFLNGVLSTKRPKGKRNIVDLALIDPIRLAQIYGVEPTRDYINIVHKLREKFTAPMLPSNASAIGLSDMLYDPAQQNPWGGPVQYRTGKILNGQYEGTLGPAKATRSTVRRLFDPEAATRPVDIEDADKLLDSFLSTPLPAPVVRRVTKPPTVS